MHCILCTVFYALYSMHIILWIVFYPLNLSILFMQLVLWIFIHAICSGHIFPFMLICKLFSAYIYASFYMYFSLYILFYSSQSKQFYTSYFRNIFLFTLIYANYSLHLSIITLSAYFIRRYTEKYMHLYLCIFK